MNFGTPWAAWLLVPVALLLWRLERRTRRRVLARGAATFAVVAALTDPSCRAREREPAVAAALDVSRSVDPAALRQALLALEGLERRFGDRLAVLAFADQPRAMASARELAAVPVSDQPAAAPQALHRGHTDVGAAVDAARLLLPAGRPGRVLLLSDGRATRGDAAAAARRLRRHGIELHTRGLAPRALSPRIVAATAPHTLRAGRPAELDAVIAATAEAECSLSIAGVNATAAPVSLVAGRTHVAVQHRFDAAGDHELALELRCDRLAPHTVRAAFSVAPAARVLIAEGPPENGHLGRALRRAGFEVVERPPAALPRTLPALLRYDAVVLSDVRADALAAGSPAVLAAYVRDHGGGLLFAAGPSAFGEDGYDQTPLAEALPLRFEVEEQENDIALMIVLDKSYSMRGEKIELARAASRAALQVLEDEHRFGLIAFDWNPALVVPLQPARQRASIGGLIDRIEATAQTNFFPALELALAELKRTPAKIKHVVLLSDGKTYPDAYERLLLQMRAVAVTVSTVAIGAEADRELLGQIAQWGGGRAHVLEDARRVVAVLVEETEKTLDLGFVEGSTAVRVHHGGGPLAGLPLATAPPLLGFITTTARERAQVWLTTANDDKPLLASWRYGLGRVTMFAGDVKGRWGADWVRWPQFEPLFAQLVRQLESEAKGPRLALERRGDELLVSAELVPTLLDAAGLVTGAAVVARAAPLGDAAPAEVALVEAAPGLYRGRLALAPAASDPAAPLLVELMVNGAAARRAFVNVPASAEDEPGTTAADALARLVAFAAPEGTTEGPLERVFAPAEQPVIVRRPWWPWCLLTALCLYLAELVARRRPWVAWSPRPQPS